MKKVIYFIGLLFSYAEMNAQQKDINLIISIDGGIVVSSLSGLKLIAISSSGNKETINADYYPGNLALSDSDYKRLLDTAIKTVHLAFIYVDYQDKKQQSYSYEIDLNKGWLKHYYYIVRIYNTTKKPYTKMFTAPAGKTYVYEFDYPGGSTKLIRKRI